MRNTPASKQPASKQPARKLPNRKLLGAIIAATLFVPTAGFTLGLGEIEVNSALNQKLSADIELLSTTPEDTENVIVKLASRESFTRAGLDRPYSLNDLRFKAEIINGVPYIRVSSSGPIREPFLNFLVEVDWPNGHLLREYTVLLDPPVFMTQAANAAPAMRATSDSRPGASTSVSEGASGNIYSAPTYSAPTYSAPVVSNTVVPQPMSQPTYQAPTPVVQQPAVKPRMAQAAPQVVQQQVAQPAWNPPAPSEYKIQSGDTAWSLADAMRPDQSVSVEQMMIAMLRNNPDSFIDGNINGLRRGYILRVPDYDQIASVSKKSARALVREQASLWRQYQQSKAGAQLASAMEKTAGASADSPTGSSQAARKEDAYLEIVSAGTGASTVSSKDPTKMTAKELRAELALARERIETERVEKEGLQQKVSQLEESAVKMKGMLSIEDDQLSDVQALNLPVDNGQTEKAPEDVLAELKDSAETAVEDVTTDAQEAADTVAADIAAKTEEIVEGLTDEKSEDAETAADDALFVDETTALDTTEGMVAEQIDSVAANENIDTPQPQPATTGMQSWIDKIMSNPTLAAAAGGGLLLLLGLIGWLFKRNKAGAEDMAVVSGFDGLENLAAEVVEEQKAELQEEGEEEVDHDTTTVMDSTDDTEVEEAATEGTAEDKVEEDDEGPRDDVIAEADVYLAYGIYQQAEQLLTQAIADNPDRNDYRLKLAETHYASKDADAFTEVATEIKEKAGEDSSYWKKALVMGQDLCSDNPMFQGSLIGGLDLASVAPKEPEMDLDLGLDSTAVDEMGEADNELDTSLEDTELELPEVESLAELDNVETDDLQADEIEAIDELEFDLSDTGAIEPAESVAEDEFSLDIDASELDIEDVSEDSAADIDFGLDEVIDEAEVNKEADAVEVINEVVEEAGAIPIEEVESIAVDEEEISLDLTDTLHLDMDSDAEEVNLDLTDVSESLNLDLDDDANDSIEIISESAADDDEFDLSSLDDVDEISTKLDLARAYLDMGDKEGTRSILDEVLAEGNDDQKHEANSLMAKLG